MALLVLDFVLPERGFESHSPARFVWATHEFANVILHIAIITLRIKE